MRDAEVIVVGGGPAGSATALLLARAGRDVLLLDKERFPREKACAEYLSPGTETVLRRMGTWEAVAGAGPVRLRGMVVYSPGGHSYVADYAPELGSFPGAPAAGRAAYGLPRATLDARLLALARAEGVCVVEGVHARELLEEGGRVVGVAARDGAVRELRARFVVGADGRHSMVARRLGLSRPARWPRRLGLATRYQGVAGLTHHGELHVGRWGYCGLAPLGGGLANVALVVDCRRAQARRVPLATFFEQELRQWTRVVGLLEGAYRARDLMGVGPLAHSVTRCAGAGFVLVGDAAGFLDPFTGEGVYEALRGGELAAAALEEALRRPSLEAEALARYVHGRRMELGPKRALGWLVQAFIHRPRLMDYVTERLARRPELAHRLAATVGDYGDAAEVLSPGYLVGLLRP